jgi:hypothetical protein
MSKAMDIFNWQRFLRVFFNDLLLLQARRIGVASLGLMGVGILVYVTNVTEIPDANQGVGIVTFLILLIGGGSIFTSMIFNDMHHPLERFHYLMLPCSNLERFVSRYLITAPLFLVYAVVLFKVFEVIANFICSLLWYGDTVPVVDFGNEEIRHGILGFFVGHVFVFTGAIWFRSYSLIKTMMASFVFWSALGAVFFIALRIFYWDSFISWFETNPEGPYINGEALTFGEDGIFWYHKLLLAAFLLWVLFLAYKGLEEHEVQDGL